MKENEIYYKISGYFNKPKTRELLDFLNEDTGKTLRSNNNILPENLGLVLFQYNQKELITLFDNIKHLQSKLQVVNNNLETILDVITALYQQKKEKENDSTNTDVIRK